MNGFEYTNTRKYAVFVGEPGYRGLEIGDLGKVIHGDTDLDTYHIGFLFKGDNGTGHAVNSFGSRTLAFIEDPLDTEELSRLDQECDFDLDYERIREQYERLPNNWTYVHTATFEPVTVTGRDLLLALTKRN